MPEINKYIQKKYYGGKGDTRIGETGGGGRRERKKVVVLQK